jgi:hypothetical protein
LNKRFNEQVHGQSSNISDAISFLHKSFENLSGYTGETFVWAAARDEFVENFTKLALRSQT